MQIVLAADVPLPKMPTGGRGAKTSWQAAWISALLHAGALAALCTLLLPRRPLEAPPQPGFMIVMTPPSVPDTEQPLQESVVKSAPSTVVTPLTAPRPLSLALPRSTAPTESPSAGQPAGAPLLRFERRAHVAVPSPSHHPSATPPPADPSSELSEKLLSGLEARIGQAVQAAANYPASARFRRLQGRTQVRFDYSDGTAATLGIATSSTSPILDRAALAAVRNATLPRAPATIGARKLPVLVWVDFHLVQQD